MQLRVVVSVSNDLATDQRVRKQCQSMHSAGHRLFLIGRKLAGSLEVKRPYRVLRLHLFFRKKAFFYAELNLRLFFLLLFSKADLLYANDLDTLPANALVSWLRRLPLVYDSHEFFTEVPEIQHRPAVKQIWKWLERRCIGRAHCVITVNESIAKLLKEEYHLPGVWVVRNVPEALPDLPPDSRDTLGLPMGVPLLILQGSGINMDRGSEELLEALALLNEVYLLVVGSGDAIPKLKLRALKEDLRGRVLFKPRMPYTEMMRYTRTADVGVSLDKDTNINYRYSLPNKVFDYIAAGIPILASDLPEVRRLLEGLQVGVIAHSHAPADLAKTIQAMIGDRSSMNHYRQNAQKARNTLHWNVEFEPVIRQISRMASHK